MRLHVLGLHQTDMLGGKALPRPDISALHQPNIWALHLARLQGACPQAVLAHDKECAAGPAEADHAVATLFWLHVSGMVHQGWLSADRQLGSPVLPQSCEG